MTTILVTGATGAQGSATIRALLDTSKTSNKPIIIHALVRDPTSPNAQSLAALSPNVKLFRGDFDDTEAIQRAATGATSIYINVTPTHADMSAEVRHGHNLITASRAAGVRRAIYTSVTTLADENFMPRVRALPPGSFYKKYLENKVALEEATKNAGWEDGYTILRPAAYFSNFSSAISLFQWPRIAKDGVMNSPFSPGKKLELIDVRDVGRVAAKILLDEHSGKWHGRVLSLASELFTVREIADRLTRAVDGRKEIRVEYVPREVADEEAKSSPRTEAFLFWEDAKTTFDVEETSRDLQLQWTGWDEYAMREKLSIERAVGL